MNETVKQSVRAVLQVVGAFSVVCGLALALSLCFNVLKTQWDEAYVKTIQEHANPGTLNTPSPSQERGLRWLHLRFRKLLRVRLIPK